jgi:SAM-dependent methyltransferase
MRTVDSKAFEAAYQEQILAAHWNEPAEHYPRYRPRYEGLLAEYAALASDRPVDVLEIGGGQLALLARLLWGDRSVVADLEGPHFAHLNRHGVETMKWDLLADEPPFQRRFDVVIFSEVIEHLPVPGHIPLEKLRRTLRPGGRLLCSTPNLYRPRNVVYLLMGKPIFDHFRYPDGHGLGHVLEYSQDHLRFQLEQAGFKDCRVQLRQFWQRPESVARQVLGWAGAPLRLIPRFRDNLVATAVTAR